VGGWEVKMGVGYTPVFFGCCVLFGIVHAFFTDIFDLIVF
jgi:hypothetical protein